MKKFTLNKKFLVLVLILINNFIFAGPGAPEPFPEDPTSPIDMYWFYLAAVAVVFIIFAAKKYKKASV